MFENELFIILGMLFAKYFRAYIYNFSAGVSGGGIGYGGGRGKTNWRSNLKNASTGRGGIISSKSNSRGESGRPGAYDNATGPSEVGSSGIGADVDAGGGGFHPGGFGYGGSAITAGQYQGTTTSAGGGGGFYGGGASFMDAGGGGGSSWCYSETPDGLTGLNSIIGYNPPPWLTYVEWIGYSISTLQYFQRNSELFDVNTYHLNEYEKFRMSLGNAFDAFCALHTRASGNGLILISLPNQKIEIDRINGVISGIGDVIEYTGSCVQWSPPQDGQYEFILWGAQGGTVSYTPQGMNGLTYQQYTGGFGGCVGLFINLTQTFVDEESQTQNVVIDCLVGQMGSYAKNVNAWNGGGNALNCTGGGGATDLRFDAHVGTAWQAYLGNRFAVAGGGGGCIGTGNGGLPQAPFFEPWASGGDGGDSESDSDTLNFPDPSLGEGPQYYLVNDRSLVYVNINYFTQSNVSPGTKLNCTISINNGNEGVLSQDFEVEPISGFVELVFPLNQIYKPNTDTHWVTITAQISGLDELMLFAIPNSGLVIRVETEAGVNESNSNTNYNNRALFAYKIDKIDFADIARIYWDEIPPIGDIHIEHIDSIDSSDAVKILLKAVEIVRISIVENFESISDLVDKELRTVSIDYFKNIESIDFGDWAKAYSDLPSDLIVKILEKFDLLDAVKLVIQQMGNLNTNSIDSIDNLDSAQLRFENVQVVRKSNVDSIDNLDSAKLRFVNVQFVRKSNVEKIDSSDCARITFINS